jgi:tetratricopeptide (TPR) repeat protein
MKRTLLLLAFLAVSPLAAQTITFKDGRTIQGVGLKRSGNSVLSSVNMGTGKGTISYPLAGIARIDFLEPSEIDEANKLLSEGKPAAAIAKLDPVLAEQAPFRTVPGNRWDDPACIKLMALAALRRDAPAEALSKEILSAPGDQKSKQAAELVRALILARKGDAEEAIKLVQPIFAQSNSKDTLAAAWVCMGDGRLELKDHQAALKAYLHVPIFYPRQTLWMPAALLGSARAFEALEEFQHAKDSLVQLRTNYPSSPEAALGEGDLKRIDHKLKTRATAATN